MDDEKLIDVIDTLTKSVKDMVGLIENLTERVKKLEQRNDQAKIIAHPNRETL